MTRKQLFDAVRPFAPGRSLPPDMVPIIDGIADRFGLPATPAPPASVGKKPTTPAKAGALVAAVGAVAAAILSPLVSGWESGGKQHLTAYADVVGVWTICDGETLNVKKGDTDTPEGCAIRLDTRLAQFAREVVACTPNLRGRDEQWAAATSLAYNIGSAGYCKSTVDRQFDAGNFRAACDAFLMWDKAGGKRLQGLTNRRRAERELCLKGVPA